MREVQLFGVGAVLSSRKVGLVGFFFGVCWAALLELAGVQEECLVLSLWMWPVWNGPIGDIGLQKVS